MHGNGCLNGWITPMISQDSELPFCHWFRGPCSSTKAIGDGLVQASWGMECGMGPHQMWGFQWSNWGCWPRSFFPPEMRISGGHLGDSTRCSQCLVSSLVWTRRAIQQPEAPPAGTVYFIQCWDFPNIQCIFFRPKILSPHQPKKEWILYPTRIEWTTQESEGNTIS